MLFDLFRLQGGGDHCCRNPNSPQQGLKLHLGCRSPPAGHRKEYFSEFAKACFSWHILHFYLCLADFCFSFKIQHSVTFSRETFWTTVGRANCFLPSSSPSPSTTSKLHSKMRFHSKPVGKFANSVCFYVLPNVIMCINYDKFSLHFTLN